MVQRHIILSILAAIVLEVTPLILARGDDGPSDQHMAISGAEDSHASSHNATMNSTAVAAPPSYFTLSDHSSLLIGHIILMTIGWVFILPIDVMFSIVRSRLALPAQLVFLLVNAVGLLVGRIYNDMTPDFYENNAHHTLGWIVTWIVSSQAVVGIVHSYARSEEKRDEAPEERRAFLPVSVEAMVEHRKIQALRAADPYRLSHDSGHGTESTSSRRNSISSVQDHDDEETLSSSTPRNNGSDVGDFEKPGVLGNTGFDRFLSRKIPLIAPTRVMKYISVLYDTVDRLILVLGFITFATGIVTYGGLFRGNNIFNGLAHFIKGGIFFWYGVLALGRCMGAFADRGWAWNVKPSAATVGSRKAASRSAEFVESFVIFFYGSTNVFLEHLAAWGGAWTAQDLEHVSISIMFFGGGLCGMLIESRRIRDLLNTNLLLSRSPKSLSSSADSWEQPRTYGFSLNPLPGLIILLLGLMMSSHHQASMVSTLVHKQWGTLFVGAALARGVTYILTYLSPPTSVLPSRPPSEFIVAFCLISGGLIFMASNKDIIGGMEYYDLNAMFVFTVVMGLTAFLMAWEILVLAIKGWAVRREQKLCLASRSVA